MALRAKSDQDDEKANYYFSASIRGVLIANILYIIVSLILGDNLIMTLYGPPLTIYKVFLVYFNILVFYFPFNCYILTLGYFVRSDGYPKMPFIALLIANITNMVTSIILMGVFNLGVEGSSLGSVIGYGLGAVYISRYFRKEERSFYWVHKIKIKEIYKTVYEFMMNTPEIISRIFITIKTIFYTVICSEFIGVAGLMAYLVYDNSETVVYMFLSAIAKVMSPIVTVFYKEKDYEAVEYIIKKSIKQILIISIPISILFAVYPELFVLIFTIDDPAEMEIICSALRITSVGLIGRSLSLLLSNYAQAIEQNRLASVMNLLEEFIMAFAGGYILTSIFGGVGIWYALVLADVVPLVLYVSFSLIYKKNNQDRINSILLLNETNAASWTYIRGHDNPEDYFNEENMKFIMKMENLLNEKSPKTLETLEKISDNILKDEEIESVDVTVTYLENVITITLTYEGKLINPITEENNDELGAIDGNAEYSPILGYNRAYINVPA